MQSSPLGSAVLLIKHEKAILNRSPHGGCMASLRHGQSQLMSPVDGSMAPETEFCSGNDKVEDGSEETLVFSSDGSRPSMNMIASLSASLDASLFSMSTYVINRGCVLLLWLLLILNCPSQAG